jgi:hypothetical protein
MLRKLYSLVSGATGADNPDSPQHHEVLLPGFLYGMIIKERLEEALLGVRMQIVQDMRQNKAKPFTDCAYTRLIGPPVPMPPKLTFSPIFLECLGKDQLGCWSQDELLPRYR